jgi:CRP-like cAMP-binding protein
MHPPALYPRAVVGLDLLLRTPLFAAMPRAIVEGLAARATRRKVRRGQRVLSRADAALVTVIAGRVEVVAEDGIAIRSVGPPGIFGISLAVGAPASAELRAAEDCELAVIPADAMAAAIKRDPNVAIAAIAHLAGVIGELSAEIEALRRHGLVARVRHRLAQLGANRREIAITHTQLADEIGGSRANVSRALARLEAEGQIRRRRGRIELVGR